jgi:hypothetical protein
MKPQLSPDHAIVIPKHNARMKHSALRGSDLMDSRISAMCLN